MADNILEHMDKIRPTDNNNGAHRNGGIVPHNPAQLRVLSLNSIIDKAVASINSGGYFNLRTLAKEIGLFKNELTRQHVETLAAPLTEYTVSCLTRGQAKNMEGIGTFKPIFAGLQIKIQFPSEVVSKLIALFKQYNPGDIHYYTQMRGTVLDPFTNMMVEYPDRSFQKEITPEKEEMYKLRHILLFMHGDSFLFDGVSKETVLAIKQILEEALGISLPEIGVEDSRYLPE